jgi:hypothetical protein
VTAKILRSFFHCRIHIRQRCRDIKVGDGIEMECVHQHDPEEPTLAEPVERGFGAHQAEINEERIESAGLSENLLHAQRTDEGW